MREAVIVSAVRTPVCKMGAELSPCDANMLGGLVIREAVKRAKIAPEKIDEVIYGSVMMKQYNNVARVMALEAGIPESVPAVSIDRQCATSLVGAAYASALIESGMYDTVVIGGVDMDSRRPWVLGRVDKAFSLQPPQIIEHTLAPAKYGKDVIVVNTAEAVAEKYGITREACDAFAAGSHTKAIAAWEAGRFDEQIVPVEIKDRKGNVTVVNKDGIMRPSTPETLAKLRVASGKPDGVVTAGNSSPLCDGASAAVIMERSLAEELGCEILGKVTAYAAAGVEPGLMGTGPIAATKKLFAKYGMSWDDIDLIEMNEAFAAQSLACIKALDMPVEKLNPNGGAIALGHPYAATGGILLAKMLYELRRTGKKRGLITFCVGGGQGTSVVVERI